MNVSPQKFLAAFSFAVASVVLGSGCGRAQFIFEADASLGQLNPPTVCAPFDPGNPGNDQTGLAGKIKYLLDNQSRVTQVDALLMSGHDAGVQLILNQLDVPTVRFTQGFTDPATNLPLRRSTGELLHEWFAIDVRSEMILSDSEAEGFYQLALISDDGAILDVDGSSTSPGTTLIDNDGTHATQMGCSTKAVRMSRATTRPIRLKYYQGPREHISLTLIWRKVAAENSSKDVLCGKSGNDYFWNSNTVPSTPTAKMAELTARGWKIPKAKNFILPPDVRSNPCANQI